MYMIKTVVSTDGLEPPITEPVCCVTDYTMRREKPPALTGKESINDTRIKINQI